MGRIHKVVVPEGVPYYIRTNDDGSLPLLSLSFYNYLLEMNPLIKTEIMGGGVKPLIYNGEVVTNLGDIYRRKLDQNNNVYYELYWTTNNMLMRYGKVEIIPMILTYTDTMGEQIVPSASYAIVHNIESQFVSASHNGVSHYDAHSLNGIYRNKGWGGIYKIPNSRICIVPYVRHPVKSLDEYIVNSELHVHSLHHTAQGLKVRYTAKHIPTNKLISSECTFVSIYDDVHESGARYDIKLTDIYNTFPNYVGHEYTRLLDKAKRNDEFILLKLELLGFTDE